MGQAVGSGLELGERHHLTGGTHDDGRRRRPLAGLVPQRVLHLRTSCSQDGAVDLQIHDLVHVVPEKLLEDLLGVLAVLGRAGQVRWRLVELQR